MNAITTSAAAQQNPIHVFLGQIGGVPAHVCDARELHAYLQNGDLFANWIKARIEKYGFEENQDFALVLENSKTKTGRGGDRRSKNYHLSLDMAKELSMVENNDKGREARRYFIQKEREALAAAGQNIPSSHADPLLPSEQQTLMEVAHRRLADLHDSLHGKAMAEIWSRVHRKFRVAKYSQLPRTQLTDAILYITKMDLRTATLAPEPEALPERVISNEELEQIKELVRNIASCFKSQQHNTLMGAIYRGIKNQVRIGSISEFPASRYDNAIRTLSGIHHQAMEHAGKIRRLERITLKEMGIPVN